MQSFGRVGTALLFTLSLALAACGSNNETGPDGKSPTPTDANGNPIASVAPEATASPAPLAGGDYALTGWRDGEVAVSMAEASATGRSWIVVINTATASWQARSLPGKIVPSNATTDGKSFAFPIDDTILLEDPKGARSSLTAPAAEKLKAGWSAGGLSPLPDGGFVVRASDSLIITDAKGKKIAAAGLPAGATMAAPTSVAKKYLLITDGKLSDQKGATIALWTAGSKAVDLEVAKGVLEISPSVVGLAFLRTADGWLAVDDAGKATQIAEVKSGVSAISPDGTLLATAVCPKGGDCTVKIGAPGGKTKKLDVSPRDVAAMSVSVDGVLAILGASPESGAVPPYFAVVDAKGKVVEYSLPTVSLLNPPATPVPAASAPASPSASPSK